MAEAFEELDLQEFLDLILETYSGLPFEMFTAAHFVKTKSKLSPTEVRLLLLTLIKKNLIVCIGRTSDGALLYERTKPIVLDENFSESRETVVEYFKRIREQREKDNVTYWRNKQ